MFTGIIESLASISAIEHEGSNIHFYVDSTLTDELKVDQSVAHNGVCLTVVEINGNIYKVTAVAETISRTNLGSLKPGEPVNLERCLKVGDRLDGHFVQGHVDCTATCILNKVLDGSWLFRFRIPDEFAALIIEKGSIAINGVSLTIFDLSRNEFTVTIIPYTFHHTCFYAMAEGSVVNIEFDVLGKYLLRQREVA